MAKSPWTDPLQTLPEDGVEVWLRILRPERTPVLGYYIAEQYAFYLTSFSTHVQVPVWAVLAWRAEVLE